MISNRKINILIVLSCILICLLCSNLFTVTLAEEKEHVQMVSNISRTTGVEVLYANGILIEGRSQSFNNKKSISDFTSVKFIPNQCLEE